MNVGNLPPGASVLIKITYVAELQVEGELISFRLPGSVAPWKRDTAMKDVTQVEEKIIHYHFLSCFYFVLQESKLTRISQHDFV